jgi:hypothetical protein
MDSAEKLGLKYIFVAASTKTSRVFGGTRMRVGRRPRLMAWNCRSVLASSGPNAKLPDFMGYSSKTSDYTFTTFHCTFADVFADSEGMPDNLPATFMRKQQNIRAAEILPQRHFFSECESLGLSIETAHFILRQCVCDVPTLDQLIGWSQGQGASPLVPFDDWLAIIRLAAGESI